MSSAPWIGVDFDGTLSQYDKFTPEVYGPPILPMLDRVKHWLASRIEVRIVTARATDAREVVGIKAWCVQHGLPELEVTDRKDYQMVELWDDRAVAVEHNTGLVLGGGRR